MKFTYSLFLFLFLVYTYHVCAYNSINPQQQEDAVEITDNILEDSSAYITYDEGYEAISNVSDEQEDSLNNSITPPVTDTYFSDSIIESRLNKSRFNELMRKFDYSENPYNKPNGAPIKNTTYNYNRYLKYILVFIAIATFITLLFLLLKDQKIRSRIQVVHQQDLTVVFDKETGETDFERLLAKALSEQNYRVCIRARYLIILKTLSDLKFIKWQKDKTNDDYLQETKNRTWYKKLKTATFTFEKVWYGDWPVSVDSYRLLDSFFTELNEEIRKEGNT